MAGTKRTRTRILVKKGGAVTVAGAGVVLLMVGLSAILGRGVFGAEPRPEVGIPILLSGCTLLLSSVFLFRYALGPNHARREIWT